MSKRANSSEFLDLLKVYGITKLYHFTDRDNLDSIFANDGLYSWKDCEIKGIKISKPGGSPQSRSLDTRDGLQCFVRLSFTPQHPMMYVAMGDGRISNPIILEIDISVILDTNTKFANMNATKNGANVGGTVDDFKKIHFSVFKSKTHFDLPEDEQKYFQAEVLVKNHIPLSAILNISSFGYSINKRNIHNSIARAPYTAQITRQTPTAFIFLVDHSVSMNRTTNWNGENITLSEAVARIVNNQINELLLRCIKADEIRHYFDIAVIGYDTKAYSGWQGDLEGNWFVTPKQLRENPYKTITVREEKRTRKGPIIKEIEKIQWIEAEHSGSWTHLHEALDKAKILLYDWIEKHKNEICYPPTIINITDGEYNGASDEIVIQKANELKAMSTNDGNVILFNIHITPKNENKIIFPTSISEICASPIAKKLFSLSSLLPARYNYEINNFKQTENTDRHYAMGVNVDMTSLIKIMDIGTPTNIRQS